MDGFLSMGLSFHFSIDLIGTAKVILIGNATTLSIYRYDLLTFSRT